jgi:hypothetical protein
MRKNIITILLMVGIIISASAYTAKKTVSNVGIPSHVSYVQFDNGGRVMLEAEDAYISIEVHKDEFLLTFTSNGNPIQFYVYHITGNGKLWNGDGTCTRFTNKTIKIIDSEALSIAFIE